MANISMGQYLTGLAGSVRQAQQQIGRKYIKGRFGLPDTVYQMPKVDFDLKLWFNANQNAEASDSPNLWVYPVHAYCNFPDTASVIKGSFVAMSAGKGARRVVFNTSLTEVNENIDVSVNVKSFSGEPVENVEVQFGLDPEMSQKLNGDSYNLEPRTKFLTPIIKTDDLGIAKNTLEIDQGQPAGSYIAVIVDVAGEIETVVYKK